MSGGLVWLCFVLAMADVVISGGRLLGAMFAVIGGLLFLIYVGSAFSARQERRRYVWRTANDPRVRREHLRL